MARQGLIVITGGAGFIGSGVLRYLNNNGENHLIIVDELGCSEKWRNLLGKRYIEFIPKAKLMEWLESKGSEIKAIIHLGACSNTQEVDASYLFENNYRYSIRLAEFALKNQIRFIYASSAATYGNGEQGFNSDLSNLLYLQPLNIYGFSKHSFDLWVLSQGVLHQLIGLKYFNVFGPNEYHKGQMSSAIMRMVPAILKNGKVELFRSNDPEHYADGEQKRDFIYVKDAVRMTCAFLDNTNGGLFNIGSGYATSWNQLAEAVFAALGQETKIEYVEMKVDPKKYQNYSCADMLNTSAALRGQVQCMDFKEAVREYVQDYLLAGKVW